MKTLILCLFLSPLFAAGAMVTGVFTPEGETLPKPTSVQIEFKVAFDSKFATTKKEPDQWPTRVHCSWRNISSQPVAILLKDHDSYHGTLDYPVGTQVRITNKEGKLLTATIQYPDGWWDFSGLTSQMSSVMPGDIILLKPGEVVVRQFVLDDVLRGLADTQAHDTTKANNAPFSFSEGDFKIEVRLWGLVATNQLVLRVKKNGEPHGHQPTLPSGH